MANKAIAAAAALALLIFLCFFILVDQPFDVPAENTKQLKKVLKPTKKKEVKKISKKAKDAVKKNLNKIFDAIEVSVVTQSTCNENIKLQQNGSSITIAMQAVPELIKVLCQKSNSAYYAMKK